MRLERTDFHDYAYSPAPLFLGVATTLCAIIVHGLILGVRRWANFLFVTNATLLALAGHLVEIGLWALSFVLCGEFLAAQ
jgi:hypothetical protein